MERFSVLSGIYCVFRVGASSVVCDYMIYIIAMYNYLSM